MASHQMIGNACPACGAQLDGATGVTGEARPTVGDLCICVYCGELLQFSDTLSLISLTPQQRAEVAAQHPEVWAILTQASRLVHRRLGRE